MIRPSGKGGRLYTAHFVRFLVLRKHQHAQLMQQICVNVTFAISVDLAILVPSVFFPINFPIKASFK